MTEGVAGEELDETGRTRFSLKAVFLGLAALLDQAVVPEGRVGIILSGGNIDAETMSTILTA